MTLRSAKIGLLILGLGLIFPVVAGATTILSEDFETYTASAKLGGQGSWSCVSYDNWYVLSNGAKNGSKYIQNLGQIVASCEKTGDQISEGKVEVWFKTTNCGKGASISEDFEFRIQKAGDIMLSFSAVESGGSCRVRISGQKTGSGYVETNEALNFFNDWVKIRFQWKREGDPIKSYFRYLYGSNDWSAWIETFTNFEYLDKIKVYGSYATGGEKGNFDFINDPLLPSTIEITSPVSGTTASSTFTASVSYDGQGEDWDKIMLVFENWEASTTCPVYGTSAWADEYALGYFNYGSLPYFSDTFSTSTASTTAIEVENLDENLYNCVRCYFLNTASSTMSEEKCEDYTLTIAGFIPPSQPLPIKTWAQYYEIHSDPKYATSTEIFNTIASAFNVIVQKVGSFLVDFRSIFDSNEATAKGTELGSKIPLARGYLKPINDFFGGTLPVSEFFIFALLVLVIVGVFRMVKIIVQFIRG